MEVAGANERQKTAQRCNEFLSFRLAFFTKLYFLLSWDELACGVKQKPGNRLCSQARDESLHLSLDGRNIEFFSF